MDFWERLDGLTQGPLTRKKLAGVGGVTVSAISMWKSRRNYPTADVAVRIAHALETSVEYLVTGEEPETISPGERRLLDRARIYRNCLDDMDQLDETVRDALIAAIHGAADAARQALLENDSAS